MFWKRKILFAACLISLVPIPMVLGEETSNAQIDDKQRVLPWLGADFSLNNSLGIGTFFPGYGRVPQWTSSISFSPHADLPLPQSWPKIIVDAELSANFWWLNSLQTSAFDAKHRVQFPDLSFGISAPELYEFSRVGISFSVGVPLSIPISKSSWAMNRLFATGLNAGVKWKKGQFSVAYLPSARVWIHNGEAKTIPCVDSEGNKGIVPGLVNSQNPDFEIEQYMLSLAAFRDEEAVEGRCSIVGRQNLWTLRNGISAGWGNDSHKVSAGLSYYWNFLRPLEDRPQLAGIYSNSQSFTQAVMGKIAYSYVLPLPVKSSVSAGIMSYQGVFSKMGTPLFPFFDFMTPNRNQTQFFVEMTASL